MYNKQFDPQVKLEFKARKLLTFPHKIKGHKRMRNHREKQNIETLKEKGRNTKVNRIGRAN